MIEPYRWQKIQKYGESSMLIMIGCVNAMKTIHQKLHNVQGSAAATQVA